MRTRTHEIKIRLNDEEFAHLNEMVSRSNYSREVFLRFLLNGYVMQECPRDFIMFKKDVIQIINELRTIRRNASLTEAEKSRLLKTADEAGELVRMMTRVYWPYYKEKKNIYRLFAPSARRNHRTARLFRA